MIIVKKYKNILFDMDGVLINSMQYHTTAWQEAIKLNGFNVTKKEIMKLSGMTSVETIKYLCKSHNIEYTKKTVEKIKKDKAIELDKIFQIKLYPYVLENITKLKKANFKLALVSGAAKYIVNLTIEKHFKDIFDIVITGEDVIYGKPHPEPYNTAIIKLNLNKEETVVIEDALSGIQSANAAGIDVLAITTSFEKKELLDATQVFDSHQKLFKYLNI